MGSDTSLSGVTLPDDDEFDCGGTSSSGLEYDLLYCAPLAGCPEYGDAPPLKDWSILRTLEVLPGTTEWIVGEGRMV
jgi:hypothetical protein